MLDDVERAKCGVLFERLADGARVRCILSPAHECAHAFGEQFERPKNSTGAIVTF
jgi:hypothetical protein